MISRLHYITQDLPGISHAQLAEEACKGGAGWVQLRVKNKPEKEFLVIAEEVKNVCKKYSATLIINDNVRIAKEILAGGVHLGKEDMDPAEARKILGNNFIIGGSTNTAEDVTRMINAGVDYIGLGPCRFTATRENLNPVLGIGGIKKIIVEMRLIASLPAVPVIAIGGITPGDIPALMQAGVHGVAVSSAINRAPGKQQAVKKFIQQINTFTPQSTS
jgi:thiamine-phosphate pyrophosphorylase